LRVTRFVSFSGLVDSVCCFRVVRCLDSFVVVPVRLRSFSLLLRRALFLRGLFSFVPTWFVRFLVYVRRCFVVLFYVARFLVRLRLSTVRLFSVHVRCVGRCAAFPFLFAFVRVLFSFVWFVGFSSHFPFVRFRSFALLRSPFPVTFSFVGSPPFVCVFTFVRGSGISFTFARCSRCSTLRLFVLVHVPSFAPRCCCLRCGRSFGRLRSFPFCCLYFRCVFLCLLRVSVRLSRLFTFYVSFRSFHVSRCAFVVVTRLRRLRLRSLPFASTVLFVTRCALFVALLFVTFHARCFRACYVGLVYVLRSFVPRSYIRFRVTLLRLRCSSTFPTAVVRLRLPFVCSFRVWFGCSGSFPAGSFLVLRLRCYRFCLLVCCVRSLFCCVCSFRFERCCLRICSPLPFLLFHAFTVTFTFAVVHVCWLFFTFFSCFIVCLRSLRFVIPFLVSVVRCFVLVLFLSCCCIPFVVLFLLLFPFVVVCVRLFCAAFVLFVCRFVTPLFVRCCVLFTRFVPFVCLVLHVGLIAFTWFWFSCRCIRLFVAVLHLHPFSLLRFPGRFLFVPFTFRSLFVCFVTHRFRRCSFAFTFVAFFCYVPFTRTFPYVHVFVTVLNVCVAVFVSFEQDAFSLFIPTFVVLFCALYLRSFTSFVRLVLFPTSCVVLRFRFVSALRLRCCSCFVCVLRVRLFVFVSVVWLRCFLVAVVGSFVLFVRSRFYRCFVVRCVALFFVAFALFQVRCNRSVLRFNAFAGCVYLCSFVYHVRC